MHKTGIFTQATGILFPILFPLVMYLLIGPLSTALRSLAVGH